MDFESEIEHDGESYRLDVTAKYNLPPFSDPKTYDISVSIDKMVGEEKYPADIASLTYITKTREYGSLYNTEGLAKDLYNDIVGMLNGNYGDGWDGLLIRVWCGKMK